MISFCFCSQFISLYEHILQFFSLFVILWLATYDFAWDWDGSHRISPRKHRWTPLSRVYETICFCHSRSFIKLWCTSIELYVWDQLTRNLFEIWRDLCLYFSRPLSWCVASFSLRCLQLLLSFDILAAWCNRDTGVHPLLWDYQA